MTSQSIVCVITPTVLRASHPLFVWHHTRHRYNIFYTIEDIISTLYEIKPLFMKSHTLYLTSERCYFCHYIQSIDDITPKVYIRSHPLYFDIIFTVYNNIFTLFVQSQWLYLCLTPTISMISHTLYIWHCITICLHQIHYIRFHIHSLWHHPTLFMTSQALYSWHHSHDI